MSKVIYSSDSVQLSLLLFEADHLLSIRVTFGFSLITDGPPWEGAFRTF